ncbi:hypothetical protein [Nocardia asiatica]|uniref:hypothetical protein n=1 Tax=Nocardia asiatica TaxID=209252 RepID=UPI002457BE52|nr:hypothetical protein [Nocardia asiatica]
MNATPEPMVYLVAAGPGRCFDGATYLPSDFVYSSIGATIAEHRDCAEKILARVRESMPDKQWRLYSVNEVTA